VADHDRGIQVQHQAGNRFAGRGRGGQPVAGLTRLGPGHLPCLRTDRAQPGDRITVQIGQQPPGGRIRGHLPEQVHLVAQHRQIRDRLATIGDHHRQIHRDPTGVVSTLPLPQPSDGLTEPTGQPGCIGDIGQQTGAGVAHHTPPIRAHRDLRTCSGSLHLASAFRDGRSGPSTSQIIPDQKALPHF
jgi:hypothetical protein